VEKYHELADEYLNCLVEKLEQLQEEDEDVDCEYSAGVLTLVFPPAGTYVINKQPPNQQIWLSSPTTGPKRFDYVVLSEGQDAKEGTGQGEWVYLRDGSTLTDLLEKEIGVDMSNFYAPIPHRGD
jgi:frataxin